MRESYSRTELRPVEIIPGDEKREVPEKGIGLCLSGGGYRAMLFHLGALWRLNEVGILPSLNRVSSVSGGSITAGVLGLVWKDLAFDARGVSPRFEDLVVGPVRRMASHTIDRMAVLLGIPGPSSVGNQIARAYDKHLFKGATLQDLPDNPRFVINATNVQSGAVWRFMKPYMRDWRVGEIRNPTTPLATAVAASSAFPPFLSPVVLEHDPDDFTPNSGHDLQREPYTSEIVLTDGGVYDNLGLETVWKRYQTVLVTDGGGKMSAEEEPKHDWARHSHRILELVDNQVRSLRYRSLIESYKNGERSGAYWGIRTDISEYGLANSLPCPFTQTTALANVPTRLKALDPAIQERLINWGYAVSDAAIRKYYKASLSAPTGFPYPDVEIG